MGTWGPGNFENDGALDYVHDVMDQFVKEAQEIFDDDGFDLGDLDAIIMPKIEIVITIVENCGGFIFKHIVKDWKEKCLKLYDSEIDDYDPKEEYKVNRRKVIEKTFEKSGEGPWLDGELPCCPSGGLIGCGHAVGATGIMSTGEAALQLRGEAGKHQVKTIEKGRAISHSIGGPGAAYSAVIVLER